MKEKIMLHIAMLIPREGMTYSEMASEVVEGRTVMMADASQSALKERLRARIERNPDERWLILSGNTIAETACPPVRFRSV